MQNVSSRTRSLDDESSDGWLEAGDNSSNSNNKKCTNESLAENPFIFEPTPITLTYIYQYCYLFFNSVFYN